MSELDDFKLSYDGARRELAEGEFTDITSQADAIAAALGRAEGNPDRLYDIYDLAAVKWE